jgi:hypothetical protein
MKNNNLTKKQNEFNKAMKAYETHAYYQYIYRFVSLFIVTFQFILLFKLISLEIGFLSSLLLFGIAYFLTDFINGLVHMYMDNNDNYNSKLGSFIASFHLHHQNEKYKNSNLFVIYFNESGAKFWLVPYLLLVYLLSLTSVNLMLLFVLIVVGILSSVAEVSHYLCHNSNSKFVHFLQNIRIFLPMSHHRHHHEEDNVGYAFLNGTSDFILDKIAKKFYGGYQEGTDKHYETYEGAGTKNRDLK